jgi:CRP-like cAMP-binding protein
VVDALAAKAFLFGIISAASLPLGAIAAMWWTPRPRAVAAMMAFGAGALLAALSIDLVAKAVSAGAFYPLAAGCLAGCGLFAALNHVVNARGGFLRKAATTVRYLTKAKSEHVRSLADRLSAVPLFQELPPRAIADLLPQVQERTYHAGTTIIRQGEPGDSFFVIETGEIRVVDDRGGGRVVATLGDGDVFGEMALLTGEPRSATAVAIKETRAWIILKEQFDRLLEASPPLAAAVARLAEHRGAALGGTGATDARWRAAWARAATRDLEDRIADPTEAEVREAAHANQGAPLAIFLGSLLDGIPESLVIGSSLVHALGLSLLAGLFLANFPEALGSAVGMRQQGYRRAPIVLMWLGLMLLTGVGASVGALFFTGVSTSLFALLEGVAAGAMLTMIAETMLPEAYHKGGAITGVSTLLGFLTAIFFKTLE